MRRQAGKTLRTHSARAVWGSLLCTLWSLGSPAQELEEITVTAQKRAQRIHEVALSVSALQDQTIEELLAGGGDLLSLSSRVPSLLIESSNGRLIPRLYIRGVGNVDFDINASQPVSLVYDSVVLENPAAKSFPLFDIDRVEVLRGPQGTLFGRNTTGGILKIESRRPSSEPDGYVRAGIGSYEHRNLEAAYGGPLGERLHYRVAFLRDRVAHWVDNRAPGYLRDDALGGFSETAYRVQAHWLPEGAWEARMSVHGRSLSDGTPSIFRANAIRTGEMDLVDGFRRDTVYLDAIDQMGQEQRQFGGTIFLAATFEHIELTSVTGLHKVTKNFSRGDIDGGYGSIFGGVLPSGPGAGIPFDAQTEDSLRDHHQVTQELRIERALAEWRWRLGLYLFSESLTIDTTNYDSIFVPGAVNGRVRQLQDTQASAVFGTIDLQLSERLEVSFGARYSHDDKTFSATRTLSPLSGFGVLPIGPLTVAPSDSVLTGDVSLLWGWKPSSNVFVRVARGHRAPSIQGRLLFQDSISVADTEINHSVEAGLKNRFLGGRMRTAWTLYGYAISDHQLTKIGGTGNVSTLLNADRTVGYGFESELDLFLNANLLVGAGLSLNATRIDDPGLTVSGCGSAALLRGCTMTDPQVSESEFLIDGNSLYYAPRWMGNLRVAYQRKTGAGTLFIATDWAWRSKVRFTLYESKELGDDAMAEGGLRMGYRGLLDRYEIELFARNITDQVATAGAIDFNNLTAYVNSPRVWGIGLRLDL